MFTGAEFVEILNEMQVTHVVAAARQHAWSLGRRQSVPPGRPDSFAFAAKERLGRSQRGFTWAGPIPS